MFHFSLVSAMNRSLSLLSAAALLALTSGCGRKPIEVRLLPPQGEPAELLWWGVEQRYLIGPKGEVFSYQEGKKVDLSASPGDALKFEGRDGAETVWISGECQISKDNQCLIPLHRRLQ